VVVCCVVCSYLCCEFFCGVCCGGNPGMVRGGVLWRVFFFVFCGGVSASVSRCVVADCIGVGVSGTLKIFVRIEVVVAVNSFFDSG